MKRIMFAVVLSLLMSTPGLLGLSAAEAVSCGATLGPGGSFTLTGDLGPCTTANALTVHGPTTVNLDGHTVTCTSSGSNGIEIIGSGAVVKNGRVTGCINRGVDVQGSGAHQVRNVLTDHNGEPFVIGSSGNSLTNNSAVSNGDADGFIVQFSSHSNTLTAKIAVDNGRGFLLLGDANSLTGNTAAKNVEDAFLVDSSRNALHSNTATQNGHDGFWVFLFFNSLGSNQATANGNTGIHVGSGSESNVILGNVALGNSEDLVDNNDRQVVEHLVAVAIEESRNFDQLVTEMLDSRRKASEHGHP